MTEQKKSAHLDVINIGDTVICPPMRGRHNVTQDQFLPMCMCITEGRNGEASYFVAIPVPVEEFAAGWHKYDKQLHEDYKKRFCNDDQRLHYAWPETGGTHTPRGVKCYIESDCIEKLDEECIQGGRIISGQTDLLVRSLSGYKLIITKIFLTSCRGRLVKADYTPIDRPKTEKKVVEVAKKRPSYQELMEQYKAKAAEDKTPVKTLTLHQIEALNNSMGKMKGTKYRKGQKQK